MTPRDNDNLPDIGDAVLLEGERYLIHSIDERGICRLQWTWGDVQSAVDVNRLGWDRDARAWRDVVPA